MEDKYIMPVIGELEVFEDTSPANRHKRAGFYGFTEVGVPFDKPDGIHYLKDKEGKDCVAVLVENQRAIAFIDAKINLNLEAKHEF